MYSIVDSCKYSNWPWVYHRYHRKKLRLLGRHKTFWAWAESRWKRSLEAGATAGSTSLELQTPWSQGLRANLFPRKNFDTLSKTWSLWTPGEIKGPKQTIWNRLVCVDRQYTVSGLPQTQFHTGVIKVRAPQHCVRKATFHFYFSCDSYWDGMNSILRMKKL